MNGPKLQMHISINIRQEGDYNGLRLEDEFQLKCRDFLEMAKVLSQFNDLVTRIKQEG